MKSTSRVLPLAVALLCLLAGSAGAQSDLDLLQTTVPPNVMILFDNSGSMEHVMWDEDFGREVFHGTTDTRTKCSMVSDLGYWIAGSSCPGSGLNVSGTDVCPNNEVAYGSGGWHFCDDLPGGCSSIPGSYSCSESGNRTWWQMMDFTTGPDGTRWSVNYLHWLMAQVYAGGSILDVPILSRLDSAKTAIDGLIEDVNPDDGLGGYTEVVRFGLANFATDNGGFVQVPIANGNKSDVLGELSATIASTWTPVSEALVDVGRYFADDHLLGSYSEYNRSDHTGGIPGTPMDEYCRKNFVVVVTDGEPTQDLHNHHGAAFTSTFGNTDSDSSECAAIGTVCSDDPVAGRDDGLVYTSSGTDWLDDVTYDFARRDFIPDTVLDEQQRLVTYTVGFNIDHPLLSEAAINGDGRYFTTSDHDELIDQLSEALQEIIERSSSLTAATVPSSRTAFGDGFYTAFFVPSATEPFWPGHLQAYRLSEDLSVLDAAGDPALDATTNQFVEPRNPFWDAADQLQAQATRTLYTSASGARMDFDTSSIDYTLLGIDVADDAFGNPDPGLPAPEWSAYPFDPSIPDGTPEQLADTLVDYISGKDVWDEDSDTDTTENRAVVLGDIFHSNPIAIGPPPAALTAEEGFGPVSTSGTFQNLHQQRQRVIYVGANDGMLHALDGGDFNTGDNPGTPQTEEGYYDLGTGNEEFGYVPGFLLDKLKMIPRNTPRSNYYVDGSPSAADVWFPSGSSDLNKDGTEWATILVTAVRQGGHGYFALDVTDPSDASYPGLLWEFTDASEPLAETWGEAIITRVKWRGASDGNDHCGPSTYDDGDCIEKWVVIVSGGYATSGDPNLTSFVGDPALPGWEDNGKAIFILDAQTGAVLAKLEHDASDAIFSRMKYAIPSTPGVLDLDFDGYADVVYVGDLGGQVWKWDISSPGEDGDSDGLVDATVWPGGIFFSSPPENLGSGNYHYHSIFFPPVATYIDDDLVLGFASGERTDLDYEGPSGADDNNRFWAVWDRYPTGSGSLSVLVSEAGNPEPSVPSGMTLSLINDITGQPLDPITNDDGYYIVVDDGEKFTTNHIVFAGLFLTLTYVPDNSAASLCDPIGSTKVWVFDLSTGGGMLTDSGGAQTRTAELGNGAPTDPRISVSHGEDGTAHVELIGQTSVGEVFKMPVPAKPPKPVEIVYWRQRF
jgi:type IV pilus assembly protein PilY1